ncbi:type I-C CRISPR-associated protein Cas8c/Csd1 [Ruminiclostridium papyrosolvens DSM 2782]|uniref:type I-C CRISPR-associated protein Cas8c/Csd1 n=1 Tax=Ruminiclostridium papyrosolvens TaxID=29362 RepID=UPI001FA78154|nr:type I-C CRISPR-associated protein Cas8c/Csd1 [Ruminiclostridium papyrosolvens]WES35717.1 type I-C CRISPR-associated protein Cas8c/Csd1 [Ruminiclostridium papyrosolvens DSM 2782]
MKYLGWINKLYDTYENCISEVGKPRTDGKTPLLPVAHSTQNAQIEVVIDIKGIFRRARILEKEEQVTIIPVTEDSATRSGKYPPPHPLCDKLQYVAGDFSENVEKEKGEDFFNKYIEQLEDWCSSVHKNKKVCAVFEYLKKKKLIKDLAEHKVLSCDDSGNLTKDIKLGTVSQIDAFIRFRVEDTENPSSETAVWLDNEIYKSYIEYYLNKEKSTDLCYVKGEGIPYSEKHPSKVRNSGDKAKLISANDESGFTYRGRFGDKKQAVIVSYEVSQKAHNAIRWLIDIQGYRFGNPKDGEEVIVAWGTNKQKVPPLLVDTDDIFGEEEDSLPIVSTHKEYAQRLNKAIAGYGCEIDSNTDIVIIGLNSATTGRLSITYYKELNGLDFLNRIEKWHNTCSWRHSYKRIQDGTDEKGKNKYKTIDFIGAPAPKEIIRIAFGVERNERLEVDDKLMKSTIERLLPCIIDGARLPYNIVNSAVNRASNPISMNSFNWEKTLSIACSLVKKYRNDKYEKEEWDMALDENQNDRSYLFGRLLAIAQEIESWAISTTGEKRDTNAERLMHQFKLHPYKTWGIITNKLRPYITRLGDKGKKNIELMTKVNSMIPYEDFISSESLKDSYILGYYCQRQVFIDEMNRRVAEKKEKKLENIN